MKLCQPLKILQVHLLKFIFLFFKEREKKREEKRIQAEYLKEWSRPRDDLECEDLQVCAVFFFLYSLILLLHIFFPCHSLLSVLHLICRFFKPIKIFLTLPIYWNWCWHIKFLVYIRPEGTLSLVCKWFNYSIILIALLQATSP